MTRAPKVTADQAAPELLPCPFCGKSAKLIKGKRGHFYAECQWCEVSTPNWRPDADMARSDWNRRADLLAPFAPAEVEGLVERLSNAGHGGSIVPNPRLCREAATALTAQQARIAELEGEFDGLITDLLKSVVAHAKTAAERDSLLAAIGDWARPTGANGMTTPSDHHPIMVARAKLKGEV